MLGALIAFTMMGTVASQVTATATIINMLGNEIGISYEAGAIIACLVFIIYTATSGLFGVIYTDVFQFVMLILFVYILIPASSLAKLGGVGTFLQNLAPELSTPYLDGSIVGDIITYFVFTLAGAEMWQRAFAAKSQKAAKGGPLPRNARLWAHDSARLVHGCGRAPARSGGKNHRLRLDGCGRPGIGD